MHRGTVGIVILIASTNELSSLMNSLMNSLTNPFSTSLWKTWCFHYLRYYAFASTCIISDQSSITLHTSFRIFIHQVHTREGKYLFGKSV
uniref:Uncharacterized protein n=2 Tax=Picea TaxID=3328 RepID=A0A124GMT0_PICGL|nr:hypothetical protein ABT39_MTgene1307 [Picea glauca]QHR89801.1 hypothetical protein Q903MT_gene3823 [Picea sitchensis]